MTTQRGGIFGLGGMAAVIFVALFGLTAAGCAYEPSGPNSVSRYDVGRVGYVQRGTVVDSRRVRIGGRTGDGAAIGAIAGGLGGAALGGDAGGALLGGILGAVIGGVIGNEVEESSNRRVGIEYTIELDNGDVITLVQDRGYIFRRGARVRIIGGARARIVPDDEYYPEYQEYLDEGGYDRDDYYYPGRDY